MLWLLLGGLTLFVFLGGLRAFESASVTSIKQLFGWIAALGGITLALLLVLSGRGAMALGPLVMFGPMLWQRWRAGRPAAPPGSAGGSRTSRPPPARGAAGMTRDEAYQVLGLAPGASEADIRAAHHRLMRSAHPDSGGSDWLATRINLARDVLVGRGGSARQG